MFQSDIRGVRSPDTTRDARGAGAQFRHDTEAGSTRAGKAKNASVPTRLRRNVKIATFNINDINKRLENLLAWLSKLRLTSFAFRS